MAVQSTMKTCGMTRGGMTNCGGITQIRILPTFEEVMTEKTDLPTGDPTLEGMKKLYDTNFRLLYEDNVVPIKKVLKSMITSLKNGTVESGNYPEAELPSTHLFKSVHFKSMASDGFKGIKFTIGFDQPKIFETRKDRKAYWSDSTLLRTGSFVCIIDVSGSLLYCYVDGSKESSFPESLHEDQHTAFVTLHAASSSKAAFHQIVKMKTHPNTPLAALEFPDTLIAGFEHTLGALQDMSTAKSEHPYADLLVPRNASDGEITVPAPEYTTMPGFKYRLGSLTADEEDLDADASNDFGVKELEERTTLDTAQSAALCGALSRKLALMQGPPGTGKSFVGVSLIRALLASKYDETMNPNGADIGPIVVVCYTNHALDQMLEHLIDSGMEGVVRVGGRSQSITIQRHNIRSVAKIASRESGMAGSIGASIRRMEKETLPEIDAAINFLHNGMQPYALRSWLKQNFPSQYAELFTDKDDDDISTIEHMDPEFYHWLRGDLASSPMRSIEILKETSVHDMSKLEREAIFAYWKKDMIGDLTCDLEDAMRSFHYHRRSIDSMQSEVDLGVLRKSNIVGLTTTGLARNRDLFKDLAPRVLICEEAGEALEAHLLTSILPSLHHAILIGDHEQLRPRANCFNLTSDCPEGNFSMDISLFERLVRQSGLPLDTLSTQRRMHPDVSRLIKNTIYPNLKDFPTVQDYPEVVGMSQRLFWCDHQNTERVTSLEGEAPTYSNEFEAQMTVALVRHLVKQANYGPGEIAVLTPYKGQLRTLRDSLSAIVTDIPVERKTAEASELKVEWGTAAWGQAGSEEEEEVDDSLYWKSMKGSLLRAVRLSTVDNFQGEEAKVIIISLVRSNPQQKAGFLKTSNRINVLLSRAKHGMYIIGDSKTATAKVPMWKDVVQMLETKGQIGKGLPIECPRHPGGGVIAKTPKGFEELGPEGGCNKKCGHKLACGHICYHNCHSEHLHSRAKCVVPHCKYVRPTGRFAALSPHHKRELFKMSIASPPKESSSRSTSPSSYQTSSANSSDSEKA